MKYIKYLLLLLILTTIGYSQADQTETRTRSLIPRLHETYDLGRVDRTYDSLFVKVIGNPIQVDSIITSLIWMYADLDTIEIDPGTSLSLSIWG